MKKCSTKLWKIMKLCAAQMIIATVICSIAVAHDNYGQVLDKKVTLAFEKLSLEQALHRLQDVSAVKIFFSLETLPHPQPQNINISVTDQPLGQILDQWLSPHQIRYRVDEANASIIILKRPQGRTRLDSTSRAGRERIAPYVSVSGTITAAANAEPLAGVNVLVKGTTNGTTSDAKGEYTINVAPDDHLIFSFIGYRTVEIPVNNQTILDVSLSEDIQSLNEVVVYSSGYAEESPERTTGSYATLGKELLDRNVGPDLTSRLNGLAPSLLVDQRSGNQQFFNIRGRSTILANDQPLIVVDNFPYAGDLSTINPNDIENITILRDAAAASIWGVRAGNGVIVITTRKGANRPLQVSMNSNITIGERPDLFYQSKMNSRDFIDVEKMLFDNNYFNGTLNDTRMPSVSPAVEIMLKARNGELTNEEATRQLDQLRQQDLRTDLTKYFYQPAINQQYALNLSGGGDKHTFYVGTGYDQNRSNRVGVDYTRLSLNSHYTVNPIDRLELQARVVYTQTQNSFNNVLSELTMGGRNMYPYARLADANGSPLPIIKDYRSDFVATAPAKGFLNWDFLPIEELALEENQNNLSNLRASASARYQILEGLHADVFYQYETQATNGRLHKPVESYFTRNLINQFSIFNGTNVTGYNIPVGGILTFSNHQLTSQNGRVQLSFKRDKDQHQFNSFGGIEIRQIETEGFSNRFYGYDPNIGSSTPVNYAASFQTYPAGGLSPISTFNSVSGTVDRFRSYFINTAYTYAGRYSLTATGRLDQSNLFGVSTNQRSTPLWSVGSRWIINKESFYTSTLLPLLSLRISYGFNGNIDQRVTALTTAQFATAGFSQRPSARLINPPNPELRWEKSRILNIGAEFGFKENKISGSIEYYHKQGIDLMGEGPLDPTKGFTTFKGNIASTRGHGMDVALNTTNISTHHMRWTTHLLFSYAFDKVTRYQFKPSSINGYFLDASLSRVPADYTPTEGRPLFGIYSLPWAGLDPATGDPMGYLNGEPSKNYTAIQSAATKDSLIFHGPALAPVFGAFRNTITYKQLSLSFNLTYRLGYFFRNRSISYNGLFSFYDGHGDYAKRWKQPGDERFTNVPSLTYPANSQRDTFYARSETLVERGDNIRFQDVQLTYDLGAVQLGKVSFKQFQLYTYVNNIGLLWTANNSGIDPEFLSLPLPRTYAIGLRLQF
ncbi:MAG: SusC/RagA family TonB-linked outer membrane protein [Cyclobacteriaceae bacterium]|nr:SusC/RagA family TonB-linked outer membrane protein [Cyclobacteriaceae bacterium]